MSAIKYARCGRTYDRLVGVEAQSRNTREHIATGSVVEENVKSCDRVSILGGKSLEGEISKRGQCTHCLGVDISVKVDAENFT
jgi:hypothetical protein